MMSELRWTLLILGVVFIAALAWWERRHPRQASGATLRMAPRETAADIPPRVVREPPLTLPEVHSHGPLVRRELPVVDVAPEAAALALVEPAARDRLVSTAAADAAPAAARASASDDIPDPASTVTAADMPAADISAADMPAADTPAVDTPAVDMPAADMPAADMPAADTPAADTPAVDAPSPARERELLPELPAAAPLVVNLPRDEDRRILALRLVARQPERFPGRSLRQALAAEGFMLGQFAIFHKPDDERRAVLSAANLTPPGTFDMETMDSQHYGGVSLFAVLPGPKSPPQAFDELVFTARNLNDRLHGVLQDEQGVPLTPARIAQLREQLRAGAAS